MFLYSSVVVFQEMYPVRVALTCGELLLGSIYGERSMLITGRAMFVGSTNVFISANRGTRLMMRLFTG